MTLLKERHDDLDFNTFIEMLSSSKPSNLKVMCESEYFGQIFMRKVSTIKVGPNKFQLLFEDRSIIEVDRKNISYILQEDTKSNTYIYLKNASIIKLCCY